MSRFKLKEEYRKSLNPKYRKRLSPEYGGPFGVDDAESPPAKKKDTKFRDRKWFAGLGRKVKTLRT